MSLRDFRNYAEAEVALASGPNVFLGSNGQGKTNLAEAIGFFATLGSHRVSSDQPLVREGTEAAIVRARVSHNGRSVQLEVQINRQGSNITRINGAAVRPGELPRYAHVVLFAPEDLTIVRGDPSARRRFADQLLVQRMPRMAAVIADYDRALRQRNALLKSARARGLRADALDGTLDVWDERIIALGSKLIDARQMLAADLRQPVADAYTQIAGADHRPELSWSLSIDRGDAEDEDAAAETAADQSVTTGERFRTALTARRQAEFDRALTLVGPHRDDLVLRIRDLPVKGYASHGESWSVALSLRLASAALLREESPGGDPVLILDDVFAELDVGRRSRLSTLTAGYEQVIVTAAVEADVPVELRARTVRIENGRVSGEAPVVQEQTAGETRV